MNSDATGISISLKANDEILLFILLTADGTINRMGNGADTSENEMFISRLPDAAIFQEVLSHVTPPMLQPPRQYVAPEIKGQTCTLTLAFQVPHGDAGIEFVYGSESIGPPPDVRELVLSAIKLTEAWYRQQKEMVKNRKP
jgi:hypothetical protein